MLRRQFVAGATALGISAASARSVRADNFIVAPSPTPRGVVLAAIALLYLLLIASFFQRFLKEAGRMVRRTSGELSTVMSQLAVMGKTLNFSIGFFGGALIFALLNSSNPQIRRSKAVRELRKAKARIEPKLSAAQRRLERVQTTAEKVQRKAAIIGETLDKAQKEIAKGVRQAKSKAAGKVTPEDRAKAKARADRTIPKIQRNTEMIQKLALDNDKNFKEVRSRIERVNEGLGSIHFMSLEFQKGVKQMERDARAGRLDRLENTFLADEKAVNKFIEAMEKINPELRETEKALKKIDRNLTKVAATYNSSIRDIGPDTGVKLAAIRVSF